MLETMTGKAGERGSSVVNPVVLHPRVGKFGATPAECENISILAGNIYNNCFLAWAFVCILMDPLCYTVPVSLSEHSSVGLSMSISFGASGVHQFLCSTGYWMHPHIWKRFWAVVLQKNGKAHWHPEIISWVISVYRELLIPGAILEFAGIWYAACLFFLSEQKIWTYL